VDAKDFDKVQLDDASTFTVDTSRPPYEVPCPTCHAYALQACHDEPRPVPDPFPPSARVLEHPHTPRQVHWENHPEIRVKVTSNPVTMRRQS
jgi:hypothetical protein